MIYIIFSTLLKTIIKLWVCFFSNVVMWQENRRSGQWLKLKDWCSPDSFNQRRKTCKKGDCSKQKNKTKQPLHFSKKMMKSRKKKLICFRNAKLSQNSINYIPGVKFQSITSLTSPAPQTFTQLWWNLKVMCIRTLTFQFRILYLIKDTSFSLVLCTGPFGYIFIFCIGLWITLTSEKHSFLLLKPYLWQDIS